jgi:AcrR family transcriptional regulator
VSGEGYGEPVPKRVDHEERRRQIADALLLTAAARGLHATGMREVAAEAGVSLRLVQYYFGTKEELLLSGMQHLAARFGERAMTRIRRIEEAGSQASPRDVVAAILAEALPADNERRTFAVLNAAYFALALTDPALAVAPLVKNSNAVIDVVAAQVRAAQAAGDAPAHLDPDAEALSLLAMSHGLGTSVLGGQSSAERAQAVIDYHLDRLFPASRPGLRRVPADRSGLPSQLLQLDVIEGHARSPPRAISSPRSARSRRPSASSGACRR